MALSIVAQTPAVCISTNGVERETTCRYDVFTGTAEALCAEGLISPDQLRAQAGRQPGHTTFLPGGDVCPPMNRAWREPGYKSIRQQPDGTYRVEVAVSKDVYSWRRSLEKAKEHEAEQERINKSIAEDGHKYRNWTFRQQFDRWAEEWKGTKAQLQAAGLGVGMAFPGEPGAPSELKCSCPLGFEFVVSRSPYDRAEAAAGIFSARSWYLRSKRASAVFAAHAPGVEKKVWMVESGDTRSDYFTGTAAALVLAGLVPHARYFPGQPGANKMRASFLKGWLPATTANGEEWVATITRRGETGLFLLEVPVVPEEAARRKVLCGEHKERETQEERRLAEERRLLRQGDKVAIKTTGEFKAQRANLAEVYLKFVWVEVFGKPDGPLSFDIPEDSAAWVKLAEAFQVIRDAVQDAPVLLDEKKMDETKGRLRLAAARNNTALQSFLSGARHLRLVSPGDKE